MPTASLTTSALRQLRAALLLTLLSALSLTGCAAAGAGSQAELPQLGPGVSGPPRAEVVAAAGRLPERLGVLFVRTRAVASDGLAGLMARYEAPGSGWWATVFIFDNGQAVVPDGLDSAVLREVHAGNMIVAQSNAADGVAQQGTMRIPGTPPQRCAIGRVTRDGSTVVNYGCATGVRNVILKVRLTATFAPGGQRQEALDRIMAVLLADVTRTVAGLPPLSVGTAPSSAPTDAPQAGPPGSTLRL